jgi:flagellar FliL protein
MGGSEGGSAGSFCRDPAGLAAQAFVKTPRRCCAALSANCGEGNRAMSATERSEEAAAEGPPAGRKRARRAGLLLAVPAVFALAGAGLWFAGVLPPLLEGGGRAHAEAQAARPPVFFELPEIVANLNVTGRRASYVKLRGKLELARAEDAAVVQAAMPRVLDLFGTYLREMRPEELRGSMGTYRLREELLARVNLAVAPARVTDVLFLEILVQ